MPSGGLLGPSICSFPWSSQSPTLLLDLTVSPLFKHPSPLSTSLLSALTSLTVSWREQKLSDEHSWELPPLTPTTRRDPYPPPFPLVEVRPGHLCLIPLSPRAQPDIVRAARKLLQHSEGHHQGAALNPFQSNF